MRQKICQQAIYEIMPFTRNPNFKKRLFGSVKLLKNWSSISHRIKMPYKENTTPKIVVNPSPFFLKFHLRYYSIKISPLHLSNFLPPLLYEFHKKHCKKYHSFKIDFTKTKKFNLSLSKSVKGWSQCIYFFYPYSKINLSLLFNSIIF